MFHKQPARGKGTHSRKHSGNEFVLALPYSVFLNNPGIWVLVESVDTNTASARLSSELVKCSLYDQEDNGNQSQLGEGGYVSIIVEVHPPNNNMKVISLCFSSSFNGQFDEQSLCFRAFSDPLIVITKDVCRKKALSDLLQFVNRGQVKYFQPTLNHA